MRSFAIIGFALVVAHATIVAIASSYPVQVLPEGNSTVLAVANTKTHIHVFATGKNSSLLWHKYQVKSVNQTLPWTPWNVIAVSPPDGTWWGDPAVGVSPDGSVEIFIRYTTNLDLFQIFQVNPQDPTTWSIPREGHCPTPPNCSSPASYYYWNSQLVFPTSDIYVTNLPEDGRLAVYYRGFDGALYIVNQVEVNSHQYTGPVRMCAFDNESCLVV